MRTTTQLLLVFTSLIYFLGESLLGSLVGRAETFSFRRAPAPAICHPNRSDLPTDPNLNFISFRPHIQIPDIWPSELDGIHQELSKKLALPPSLTRSFLLAAEKKLLVPDWTWPLSHSFVSSLPNKDRKTIDHSILIHKYFNFRETGQYHIFGKLLKGLNPEDYQEFLEENQKFQNSTVHLFIGDRGPSGVSSLMDSYLSLADRPFIFLRPQPHTPGRGILVKQIQEVIRKRRSPIIILDNFDRWPLEAQEALLILVQHRALLLDASLIITIGGLAAELYYQKPVEPIVRVDQIFQPTETWEGSTKNAHILRAIAQQSDSIHYIRAPHSQELYKELIEKMIRRSKTKMGPIEPSIIHELSRTAFNLQTQARFSVVGFLDEIISSPLSDNGRPLSAAYFRRKNDCHWALALRTPRSHLSQAYEEFNRAASGFSREVYKSSEASGH